MKKGEFYTREEVYAETIKYFKGDDLAATVWIDKYCLKEKNGEDLKYYELTPDDMHKRLAKEFARIESNYEEPMSESEIYELLKDFKYIVPQGSPMAGIGNPYAKTSISNCFVVGGQPDTYGGIFNMDEEAAQLMKRRGGVGNTMETYRPSGSLANGVPLGPNAGMPLYMDRFSNTTREVQQDGRRGARMLSVDVKHPNAETFIDKKLEEGAVTGANVSVKISDDFIHACDNGLDFFQVFPVEMSIYDVIGGDTDEVSKDEILESLEYNKQYFGKKIGGVQTYYKKIDPTLIQAKLVYNAWKSAEPGSLFWDNIINESPAKGYGDMWKEICTNPCGEIPLPAYDSCRLLLINLMGFVHAPFSEEARLYDGLLISLVAKAQRLMDDIVDLEIEKIDAILKSIEEKPVADEFKTVEYNLWIKIRRMAVDGRRTGLGITGEGDLIAALGYTYGTPEATRFSEALHQLIATASYEESIDMAKERGAFPIWSEESDSHSGFLKRMFGPENQLMNDGLYERYAEFGRRNIANLTIAPAGSVSILTQTTSGIEPLFSPYYFRKKKMNGDGVADYIDEVGDKWEEFPVFHRPFVQWYSVFMDLPMDDAEEKLMAMKKEELDGLFEKSPYYKATAQDVDYIEKVRMQGAVQKWVDHSISVTVNMPEDVTVEIVAEVYKVAFESGCKGITVYRDNSRGNVLSTTSVKDEVKSEGIEYIPAPKRPKSLECDIFQKTKGGENFIILVGLMGGKPYEIFTVPGDVCSLSRAHKKGTIYKSARGKYDLIGENDVPLILDISSHMIESEQNSTRNFSAMLRHGMNPKFIMEIISKYASISSFDKVISKVLSNYVNEESTSGVDCEVEECTGKMIMTEGCMKCAECGFAACG